MGQAQIRLDEDDHRRIARYHSVTQRTVDARSLPTSCKICDVTNTFRDTRKYILDCKNLVGKAHTRYFRRILRNTDGVRQEAPNAKMFRAYSLDVWLKCTPAEQYKDLVGLSKYPTGEREEIEGPYSPPLSDYGFFPRPQELKCV
jgi:hypothetical protein